MKLKSKLPIVIIIVTCLIFLILSLTNTQDKLSISTIKGTRNEINNLEIIYEDSNEYIRNKYTLKNGVTTKKVIPSRFYEDKEGKTFNVIDVTSGQDNIEQIGYSYKDKGYGKFEDIKFVYMEDNEFIPNQVLPYQGKDDNVLYKNIDKENLKEIDLIDKPIKEHIRPLASNRYNNELYVMSNYGLGNHYRNIIEISKLNTKENKLETIKTIDIYKELKNVYFNSDISIEASSKYEDKFYSLIQIKESTSFKPMPLCKVYLLTYDLTKNTYELDNISDKIYAQIEYADFNEDKLNLIISNLNKTNSKQDLEIIDINYDLINKNIISQRETLLEKDINEDTGRRIDNMIVDSENIYLDIRNYYSYGWQENHKLYTINRKNKNITYEGKLVKYINQISLQLEKEGTKKWIN